MEGVLEADVSCFRVFGLVSLLSWIGGCFSVSIVAEAGGRIGPRLTYLGRIQEVQKRSEIFRLRI